jgi:hypothetical protein
MNGPATFPSAFEGIPEGYPEPPPSTAALSPAILEDVEAICAAMRGIAALSSFAGSVHDLHYVK